MDKHSGKFIHKIIRVLTQASFGLLNFTLPVCGPISAQVASTAPSQGLSRPWLRRVLLQYCKSFQVPYSPFDAAREGSC